MAQGIERSQMVAMRINYIQKCGIPDYANMVVCDPQNIARYMQKMQDNFDVFRHIHQGLYLVSL